MENLLLLHPNGKRAMEEELIRGRDMANQLLEVLIEDHDDNKSNIKINHRGGDDKGSKKKVFPLAEDLVREVLKSFTNTLLLLNTIGGSGDVAAPLTVGDFSPSKREEGLDGTCKSLKKINTKNQRGSYKRKSIAPTWEKNTSILVEDGHAWRKYGQKKIMNAKYLRSYYRCTHMYDQHCQAIKHVQRIREDPPLYRTMYCGHHTCKSSFNSDINLEPFLSSDSSILLSFSSKQEYPLSPPLASTKGEPMEAIHEDQFAQNQLSSQENLILCDFEVYFD